MADIDSTKRHTGWAIAISLPLYVIAYLATAVVSAGAFVAALWYNSAATELASLPVFALSLVLAGFLPPLIAWRLFRTADRSVVFLAFTAGIAILAVASVVLKLQTLDGWFVLFLKFLLSVAGARLALFVDRKRSGQGAAAAA